MGTLMKGGGNGTRCLLENDVSLLDLVLVDPDLLVVLVGVVALAETVCVRGRGA